MKCTVTRSQLFATTMVAMIICGSGAVLGDDPDVTLRDPDVQEAEFAASASQINYDMISGPEADEWIDSAMKFSCSTYSLVGGGKPDGNGQNPDLVYDPAKIWRAQKDGVATGYDFLRSTPTDSAAAATALASGLKTYHGAINYGNSSTEERPIHHVAIPQLAKLYGKITGSVTTVPLSHATPAGLGGAHNISRGNYAQIANEMFDSGVLDLAFGAGNPKFDDSGRVITDPEKQNYQYVGGPQTWRALETGTHPMGWKLIETKEDFGKLADGSLLQSNA
ncbi:MAG: alkaline phosphatase, partial [Planctomycetia bacterium]|nr:alkaline phosphatase [Planctomycetia bacterium]